jgi:hypothetical protein
MTNQKNSFVIQSRYKESIQLLSQEQKGYLLDIMFEYHENSNIDRLRYKITEDHGEQYFLLLNMAFSVMKKDFDMNKVKWLETKKQRIEAGKKGAQIKAGKILKHSYKDYY